MTREEAIVILQSMMPTPCRADGKSTTHTLETIALYMAIKALESKDVLDKIRAEILQMPTISLNANDIYKCDILKIIDKYKAESEVNADADSD